MNALSRQATGQHYGSIGLSEEQADLLEVATNFCREKSPIETVRKLMTGDAGYNADVWREITELGWLAITIPEDYDGVGLTLAEVVPVMEQMGRTMLASPFLSTTLAAQAVLAGGTEKKKQSLLPKIAAGEIATMALMERDGNWDLSKIEAQAIAENGAYKLRGEKHLVCDADAASWMIVSVMRDGAPALVIVEKSSIPPDALRRQNVIDETKRAFALTLDGITVNEDAFLDGDQTKKVLDHIHLAGSLLSAAECCGGVKAVIDYTIEYLQTRKQFGKPIGSYQALKHPTVDAYVQYEQARSHLYAAAHSFGEQGTGEIATRMAKAAADSVLSHAADRSIQFHGGFGFTYDCDAQLYRRRAAWHAALWGDAAYHKKRLAELLF